MKCLSQTSFRFAVAQNSSLLILVLTLFLPREANNSWTQIQKQTHNTRTYSLLECLFCVCISAPTEINSKVMSYPRLITKCCSITRGVDIWLVMHVNMLFHKQNISLLKARLKISQTHWGRVVVALCVNASKSDSWGLFVTVMRRTGPRAVSVFANPNFKEENIEAIQWSTIQINCTDKTKDSTNGLKILPAFSSLGLDSIERKIFPDWRINIYTVNWNGLDSNPENTNVNFTLIAETVHWNIK